MTMTPLDIQQRRFRTTWRGLDKVEVDAFLNLVASDFESLVREVNDLKDDQQRSRRLLDEFRSREQAIKDTMISAQRVTEEITANAKKEAEIIMGRAELEAERLLEQAQERLTDLLGEIAEAKRQRTLLLSQIQGIVDTHQKLLELANDDDGHHIEKNLSVIRRQPTESEPTEEPPRPVSLKQQG